MGISTHNETLTISEILETDPGYDMGANHTYRYVKTSGLGIAPVKWPYDIVNGTITGQYVDGSDSVSSEHTTFRIIYMDSTGYNMLCRSTFNNVQVTGTIARDLSYTTIFDIGEFDNISTKTSTYGVVPSCRELIFGALGQQPENGYRDTGNNMIWGVNLYQMCGHGHDTWTRIPYESSNGNQLYYYNSGKAVVVAYGWERKYITIFIHLDY